MPKAQATLMATLSSRIDEISAELVKAEASHARLLAQADKLLALQAKLAEALSKRSVSMEEALTKFGPEPAAGIARLRAIEKASNAALLKLQMNMQRENQVFTSVSNVLKTRHDTIKNSIGNIR